MISWGVFLKAVLIILILLSAEIALGVVLNGVIGDTERSNSVAVFATAKGTKHIRIGESVDGFTLSDIDGPYAVVTKAGKSFRIRSGNEVSSTDPLPRITTGFEVVGHEIRVTRTLRDYVAKDGLLTIIMQACSEPVSGPSGNTIGYKLFEIDKGSAFDLIGIVDNDIITTIDDIELDSPITALRALSIIKEREQFSFKFLRNGVQQERVVIVR